MSMVCVNDKLFHNGKSFVTKITMYLKSFFENTNPDVNENFKATIKSCTHFF